MSNIGFTRVRVTAIAAALSLHGALLGLLVWNSMHPAPAPPHDDAPALPVKFTTIEQPPGAASPSVDPREVKYRIQRGVEEMTPLPTEQKFSMLRRNTRWLDEHSSAESVQQIGEMVRNATGARARAYAPVSKPPPGPFDYATMLPYSAHTKVDPDGKTRVHQIYIDKDGRTMEQTVRTQVTPGGERRTLIGVRGADGKWYETESPDGEGTEQVNTTLEMMNRSPLLRKLYDTAVLPLLDSQTGGK